MKTKKCKGTLEMEPPRKRGIFPRLSRCRRRLDEIFFFVDVLFSAFTCLVELLCSFWDLLRRSSQRPSKPPLHESKRLLFLDTARSPEERERPAALNVK